MKKYSLTEAEAQFADLIWEKEPVPSGDLVKLCESRFSWKKSTTYTMLKRLEHKKVFKNAGSIVSSLIDRDEFYARQSREIFNEIFDGSLPRFIAAFTKGEKLNDDEIEQLQKLIEQHRGE
jgi:BlaI family penicillinase repressor